MDAVTSANLGSCPHCGSGRTVLVHIKDPVGEQVWCAECHFVISRWTS